MSDGRPSVRERWVRAIEAEIARTLPAADAEALIAACQRGEPAARERYRRIDLDIRTRQARILG